MRRVRSAAMQNASIQRLWPGRSASLPLSSFEGYTEQAGLLNEQVELLALVRDARISSAQLRAILALSPQAREAITDLVRATARDDTRRHRGEHDETG